MKRTLRTYMSFLMAVMLFVMGNGTTLAHCQHNGQVWLFSFVDDECETDDDCCGDEQESEDECVETINLSIASVITSNASNNTIHIPVFSLLPSVLPLMPVCTEVLADSDAEGTILACGPPRGMLYKHCILRL